VVVACHQVNSLNTAFHNATLANKCISFRAPDYLVSMCSGVETVEAQARLPNTYCQLLTQLQLADMVLTTLAQLPGGWNSATTYDRHVSDTIQLQQTAEDIAVSLTHDT